MVVPIIVSDGLVGVLSVSTESPNIDYEDEDLRVLWVFAENAGMCIRQVSRAVSAKTVSQNAEVTK